MAKVTLYLQKYTISWLIILHFWIFDSHGSALAQSSSFYIQFKQPGSYYDRPTESVACWSKTYTDVTPCV